MLNLLYDENGLRTGQLIFNKDTALKALRVRPAIVSIVPHFSDDRKAVEDFIRRIYAEAYQAKIDIHYPVLMSVRDEFGTLLAATGFRPAADGPLFLEQYLHAPIEDVLHTPRGQIVEIGNLASEGGGASLYLFAALAAYLHHKGFTKAVATSTDFLEHRFKQMGLQPKRHAKADPDRLLGKNEDWGSYYNTQPHVISGSIDNGYKKLQDLLGVEYRDCAPRLFPRLHYKEGPIS